MKARKINKILSFMAPLLLFFIIWQIVGVLDLMDTTLLSKPTKVFERIIQLIQATNKKTIIEHSAESITRTTIALFLATTIGCSLGILLGLKKNIEETLNPIITFLMPIPGIAWAPLFITWIGFGNPTIISVGTLSAFFPIVYNTSLGIKSINKQIIWSTSIMGANRRKIIKDVILPGSLPHITTGFKLGLARSWRTVIAVEMLAATTGGLGYMVFDAREYLDVTTVYAGIILMAFLYLLVENTLIKELENKTIKRWGMIT
ncbi:MAG: hypothetical protein B6U97_03790 [Candidatus Altiarchaeales archaeon ex4484_96]|nr:MAG: hypothetical protein B6U97_03790 [Candidatus Altiarchaeales archaeon ex4484_96]